MAHVIMNGGFAALTGLLEQLGPLIALLLPLLSLHASMAVGRSEGCLLHHVGGEWAGLNVAPIAQPGKRRSTMMVCSPGRDMYVMYDAIRHVLHTRLD